VQEVPTGLDIVETEDPDSEDRPTTTEDQG